MDSSAWTDLNPEIASWRSGLLSGGIWPTEVDELEGHLRDRIDDLSRSGLGPLDPLDAFRQAVEELGDVKDLDRELRRGRRPRDLRSRVLELSEPFGGALLASYFRVARRALRRDRGYTAISTTGLALGIALCLLLAAYVRHELSYDAMHVNADRVFRVAKGSRATTPGLWGPALPETMPEVTAAVRIMDSQFDRAMFLRGDEEVRTGPGLVADRDFFDLFSWQLSQGNPDVALAAPASIVLGREVAHALFGDGEAMGQSLVISGGGDFPSE